MSVMNLERALTGELSVKESLLVIAHTICTTEPGVVIPEEPGRAWVKWTAGEHFPAPMSLDRVYIKRPVGKDVIRIFNATFGLPDEEMSLMVDRSSADLNNDPYAIEFLERFKLYPEHEHEVCLQALSEYASSQPQTPLVTLRKPLSGTVSIA